MGKYSVIVAGCGGMSNTWLDYLALRDDVELVALVDARIEAAEAMATRRGLRAPTYASIEHALSETAANLVCDITSPSSHRHVVTTALLAGCDVFGEKPMAPTLEDANAILEVVTRTGKHYAVMQNRRYLRPMRALRDCLRRGTIGKVGAIYADFFVGPHFGGFREVMDSPLLLDMAIHTFDQARFLSDADPVSAYCHEFNPPGSWYQGSASAMCIYEMSDGSVFCYRGSWSAEGFRTSWEADWRITGSNGSILWDGTNPPRCEVVDAAKPMDFFSPTKEVEVPFDWGGREGHFGALDDMFAALDEGRPAETDCRDNIKSMQMVFGALQSARTGQKVRLL